MQVLNLVNFLLLLNFAAGFFFNQEGTLFSDMFKTNPLIVLEKNILNLGTLIISLQASSWLRSHKHVMEFYMLLLTTLLGMFFMISSNNLLMFFLGLEMSTIPLAAIANFDLERRTIIGSSDEIHYVLRIFIRAFALSVFRWYTAQPDH
jgi:NADH-quinone oxidoreductase subunit N